LLEKFRLPVRLEFNPQQVIDAIGKDKKREGDHLKFVFLQKIGKALVEEIPIQEIVEVLQTSTI
jgi:3-dehydroquinate synthetase